MDTNGEPDRGHVGGLAVVDDFLMVTSDDRLLQFELSDLTSKNVADSVSAIAMQKCETNASFCSVSPKFLWEESLHLG